MNDMKRAIDINKIMKMLPHRYPLLLVDRVEDTNEDFIQAIKNVTINEDFFNGHFPGHPIMPGVLIVEAMAQVAGLFVISKMKEEEAANKLVYFMSIDNAHFRKPVTPGDTLEMKVSKIKNRGNVWKMKGDAFVNGTRVADAIFSAMVINNES